MCRSLRARTTLKREKEACRCADFDCVAPDGSHEEPTHFEAETDDAIVEQAKTHIAEYHASLGLTEEQAREMVVQGAYDIGDR